MSRRKLQGRAITVVTDDAGQLVGVEGDDGAFADAVEVFGDFHDFDAGAVEVREVPDDTPPVLARLGELRGVIYRSDKWVGHERDYIHETEAPFPELFATPDGERLVILGGAVRVRPEGLVG